MPLPLSTIIWPAIVLHDDDPELTYIPDAAALAAQAARCEADDRLIDSEGRMFSLSCTKDALRPIPTGEVMGLEDFLGLVKAHAAQTGSCCVAKLYAPSIADAMAIVASLDGEA